MSSPSVVPPCVAVFNSSNDIIELLRVVLEQSGFAVVGGHIDDIRAGKLDLLTFIEQHQPEVIVYDVAPPYERSWQFLQHLRHRPPLHDRPFVLMTTNERRLREMVGVKDAVHEIVGKPFDLEQIVKAVRAARGGD